MTFSQVVIAAIILCVLGGWAVLADPVGKAACHAVCAVNVEGF